MLEAATAIADALGVRFGEVTIQVLDGSVVLVRQGLTMKPSDLEAMPLRPRA